MKKQHPDHARIVGLIRAGKSDRSICERLKVSRKYVVRTRADLGIPPFSQTRTADEQLARFCSVPDPDGHVWWTGSTGTSGTPRIRVGGKEVPAAHSVFQRRAGRPAVGRVQPDCGKRHCLAPGHIMDDIERRKVRLQTRALLGYPGHWDICPACGADWDTEGRVEEKLSLYCRRCTTLRAQRNRKGTES